MLTIKEIVARLGGVLHAADEREKIEILEIKGLASLESARPTDISFLANSKFRSHAISSQAAVLVLSASDYAELKSQLPENCAVIEVDHPYLYYAKLSQLFKPALNVPYALSGIHPTALIDADARIDPSATIGPYVTIAAGCEIGAQVHLAAGCALSANVFIGAHTHLHPHVVVYENTQIGQRCVIHAGAVIGSDGFGFANDQGQWVKIAQLGCVRIGDDVEIGANTTIDRGALDDTVIENGAKLDNQIQIGHNVHIGAHTALAGCVGVAGSAKIGKHCMIGGAAMILGHLEIADHVVISSGTLISRSITQAGMYTGIYPAQSNQDWEKTAAVLRQLPDLRQRLKALEKNFHQERPQKNSSD